MAPESGPITVRVTRSVAVIVSIIITKQKRSASAGFKNVFITEKLSHFILITYEKSLIKNNYFFLKSAALASCHQVDVVRTLVSASEQGC